MPRWILYNLVTCFAVYWLCNLLLWYPWSIHETLGQVIMLTVNPVLWAFASYHCLTRYPSPAMFAGVMLNSILFLAEAIVSDLLFFVGIRNAADKLMHITTLYAWGFVLFIPLLVYYAFRKKILRNKKPLMRKDFYIPALTGIVAFTVITLVIVMDISFS